MKKRKFMKYRIKRAVLLLILFVGMFSININAEGEDLENDISVNYPSSNSKIWNSYGNFTKLKANNEYRYNLFHDYYVEDLAINKNVYVYFDLSKVTNDKVRSAVKGVISDFGNLNNSKIKLYSVSKPSVKHYTVVVRDFNNGASCSSTALACANNSILDVMKSISTNGYSAADYKAIIMHEFLHIFGISHTSQTATGTVMAPEYKKINSFNINNYPNDVSAWNTLNAPFRTTTETSNSTKYKYKRFLNTYVEERHTYESTGNYWKQSIYYLNGKQHRKVDYPGTATNGKLSEHYYEATGNYWNNSYYYENDGKTLKRRFTQAGTSENPITRDWYYENGVITKEIKYAQNNNEGAYYKEWEIIYKNGNRSILTYYKLENKSPLKSKHIYNSAGTEWIESTYY